MDELNQADVQHVNKINDEFADSLRVYNLRFIGRGKHLRQAQKDIIANTDLITKNTDSLASLIDDVSYTLDNFIRNTEKDFREVRDDIDDLGIELRGNIKRLKRNLSDLQDKVTTVDKRLKEIEDLALIQKEKAEAAEEE
jgi:Mg2+ and Co2+ transporter CorA